MNGVHGGSHFSPQQELVYYNAMFSGPSVMTDISKTIVYEGDEG